MSSCPSNERLITGWLRWLDSDYKNTVERFKKNRRI